MSVLAIVWRPTRLIKEPQPVSNKSTSVEEEASPYAPTMFVKNVALDPYGEWIVVKKKKTSFERLELQPNDNG